MARKPAALARELLRNFPKGRRGKGRRRRKGASSGDDAGQVKEQTAVKKTTAPEGGDSDELTKPKADDAAKTPDEPSADEADSAEGDGPKPKPAKRRRSTKKADEQSDAVAEEAA